MLIFSQCRVPYFIVEVKVRKSDEWGEKGIEVMYVSEVWFYFDLHWLWDFRQSQLLCASQFP